MINHHFLAPSPLKPSKSSPGGQIMLVDKIWAKMDGFWPLLGQNYEKKHVFDREITKREKKKKDENLILNFIFLIPGYPRLSQPKIQKKWLFWC